MEVVSAADAASSTIVFENEEAACVAMAVKIKDESAQNDQEGTNKEDPLDEEEDNIATLNTRSISNEDPISSQDNPSNFCHRLCCCIKGCTWQKLLITNYCNSYNHHDPCIAMLYTHWGNG